MVFHGEKGLREKLEILLREPDRLKKLNQTICKGLFEMDMESHAKKMSILYDRICRGRP